MVQKSQIHHDFTAKFRFTLHQPSRNTLYGKLSPMPLVPACKKFGGGGDAHPGPKWGGGQLLPCPPITHIPALIASENKIQTRENTVMPASCWGLNILTDRSLVASYKLAASLGSG